MKYIFVSDIDGTLLCNAQPLLETTKQSIRSFTKSGAKFVLCSGRSLDSAREIANDISKSNLENTIAIIMGGAAIYDFGTEKLLHGLPLDKEFISIIEKIQTFVPDVSITVSSLLNTYNVKLNDILLEKGVQEDKSAPLADMKTIAGLRIYKVLFASKTPHLLENFKQYIDDSKFHFAAASTHFYELTAKEANKGNAIVKLKELFTDDVELFAAGDGMTDVEMKKHCKLFFVPSAARSAVKEFADYIIKPPSENGIEDAFKIVSSYITKQSKRRDNMNKENAVIEQIKELCLLNGVSSREDQVIDYMYDELSKYSNDVTVDTIGNVICKFSSNKEHAKKMMIFAHTDEIGMIVRRIEEDGFIRIERIGGVSTQILPGTFVNILSKENRIGVIGTPSHHFIKADDKFSVPPVNELYVDAGFCSAQEVKDFGIEVGNMVAFEGNVRDLSSDILCGKAMDDRVGCGILLEVARSLQEKAPEWDVYIVAAVMEEYNIRGIMPAVRKIQPDVSIGIDITPACDTPRMDYNDIKLGQGVAITEMNFHGRGTLAGVLPDRKLVDRLYHICRENQIPFQKEVAPGVITENSFILFENNGVAVANVSIPTRYTHTPFECVSKSDIIHTANLLKEFVSAVSFSDKFGKERGRSK